MGAEAALPSSPEGDVAAVGSSTPRTLCGPAAASFSSSSTCSPRVEEVVTAAGGRGDGGWRKEAAACVAWSPEGRCCWFCAVSWRRPVAAGRCPGSATTSPFESTGPAPSSLWSVPSLAAATSPLSGTKRSAQSSVFLAFPSRSFFFFLNLPPSRSVPFVNSLIHSAHCVDVPSILKTRRSSDPFPTLL